jgi:hypothetical protein
MTRLLHVAALATTVISPTPALAQTRYTCGPGVVEAVHRVVETTVRETTIAGRDAAGGLAAIEQTGEQRQRQVVSVSVRLGDRLYTSASAGDPNGTLDPLRLAPGDPIGICVNGDQMVLEAADATDYRAPRITHTPVSPEVPGTCQTPARHRDSERAISSELLP